MSGWPMVALGSILVPRLEPPDMGQLAEGKIPIVSKIGFDKGNLEFRRESATKTGMILIRPGDLVLSGINASKGAIAIYTPARDENAAATIHYSAYFVNPNKADKRYLWWYLRSDVFRDVLLRAMPGGIKTEIKPSRFTPITIPLPPLAEQKRIVARVEALAGRIEEARGLRKQAAEEAEALGDRILAGIIDSGSAKATWKRGPVSKYVSVNPTRRDTVVAADTVISFIPMAAVDAASGQITGATPRPFGEVSKGYTVFSEGDVIFARITPCMQNGKSAVARGLHGGIGVGSTEFHILRPGPDIEAAFLHAIVRQGTFREAAASHFKGTAGQQRVPSTFFQSTTIPVPPLPEQRRIVAYLDGLQAKVDAVKALQAQTAVELDALLPSILQKAFRGEL